MIKKAVERLAPGQTFETEFGTVRVKDHPTSPVLENCGVCWEDNTDGQKGARGMVIPKLCPALLITKFHGVPPEIEGCRAIRAIEGLPTWKLRGRIDPSGEWFARKVAEFQAENLKGRFKGVEGKQADCTVFEFTPKTS